MLKRASNVMPILLAIVLTVASITGCGGGNSLTFPVSGQVIDTNGVGMPGVTLLFDGVPGATSDVKGNWTKTGLSNVVKVTAQKEEYVFARFEDGVPVSNTSVTKGPDQFNLKFTGYKISETHFSNAQGRIVNRGVDEAEAAYGVGLAGVTLSYVNPITNVEMSVTTNSTGDWEIKETLAGVVEVSVQSAPAGWICLPGRFLLTADTAAVTTGCTKKTYSGADILDAIAGSNISSSSDGTVMPNEATVAGDTLPVADIIYLMVKWLSYFSDGTSTSGVIPGRIPYLKVSKPDVLTPGKTGGYILFGDGKSGYYGTAVSLASIIESELKIPNEIVFKDAWNSTGSKNDSKSTETIYAPEAISIFARAINYVKANRVLPNYGSYKGMKKPTDW